MSKDPPGQSATKLFVAMDADGTLTKNSGATLAERANAGVYRIAFNTDITNCVYLATGGTGRWFVLRGLPPLYEPHRLRTR